MLFVCYTLFKRENKPTKEKKMKKFNNLQIEIIAAAKRNSNKISLEQIASIPWMPTFMIRSGIKENHLILTDILKEVSVDCFEIKKAALNIYHVNGV